MFNRRRSGKMQLYFSVNLTKSVLLIIWRPIGLIVLVQSVVLVGSNTSIMEMILIVQRQRPGNVVLTHYSRIRLQNLRTCRPPARDLFFLPFFFSASLRFSFLTFVLLFCSCSRSWRCRERCRRRGGQRRRRRREGTRTGHAGARRGWQRRWQRRRRHVAARGYRLPPPTISARPAGLLGRPRRIAD